MARDTQAPTERTGDRDETIYEHPAFAQILASRVSGNATLYASDFRHQHYITVSIRASQLHRSHSHDWSFGRQELIEVAMSEAQWATFISSLNTGSGTPCTLQHHNGELTPGIPSPPKASEKFSRDMRETIGEIQDELRSLAASLPDGPIGKTRSRALQDQIKRLASRLTSSTSFVADSFDEHMERTVEKAKVEINAHVSNVVTRTGLNAIIRQPPVSLEFHDTSEDK